MNEERFVTVDGRKVLIEEEHNLLELIRKAGIDLPTFCYHSELSVYGACRLCMVDVTGMGLVPACSTLPTDGMTVSTNTEETRKMRKIIVELLLANHNESCPTCQKSTTCQLQALARRLGITKVRFKKSDRDVPVDSSSSSLVRDPNKCVLCGDCVRICSEVQSVGAIDFAYRGARTVVIPSFGKDLDKVECVDCGQCARICPTGALTPRSEVEGVWKALHAPGKIVVAQVAPAVRVAIGEMFGLEPGVTTTGQIGAALRAMGFDRVFDTSFAADLTVIEESNEFISRVEANERLPQFTSCCPAWVKFVEQYYPEYVGHLSTCRSPQQMFGSLCKEVLSNRHGRGKAGYRRGLDHAVHGEEVRGRETGIQARWVPGRRPRPHDAGIGVHDPGGRPPLQGTGARSLRHAPRLQDRGRGHLRKFGGCVRGGAALRRRPIDGRKAGPLPFRRREG